MGTILNDETTISVSDTSDQEGDETAGLIDTFVSPYSGGLHGGHHVTFGPDGNLYVASGATNTILRYDGQTGEFVGDFVSTNAGGLNNPHGLRFGPDGNLYVASKIGDEILRYDGTTGAFLDVFADTAADGLDQTVELIFGSDGYLYVSGGRSDNVFRYDLSTGAFVDEFVTSGSGGLGGAGGLAIGPDGNLYVGNGPGHNVLRYNGTTGTFIDEFVSGGSGGLNETRQIEFRPDGFLYVSGSQSDAIHRYDAITGEYVDDFVAPAAGGLDQPIGFTFDANGNIYVVSQNTSEVLRYAPRSQAVFTVTLSTPHAEPVTVDFSTANGTATDGADYTAVSGTLVFDPGVTQRTILVPTLDDTEAESDETFFVDLSNANGGVIQDAQGEATILDDDATRTISINDVSVIEGDPGVKFLDAFVPAGSGGLDGGHHAVFGPDGNLYVAAGAIDSVLRYDGTSGAFLGEFVAKNSGGLDNPHGLQFGADGHMYIASKKGDEVLRYDGTTGSSLGTFVSVGSGGLDHPTDFVFGPDGNLYVASALTDSVLRYNGTTGAFIDAFVQTGDGGLLGPHGLTFGPDGNLYVSVGGATDKVLRYDGVTGAFIGDFVTAGSGGLDDPKQLVFRDGNLYVSSAMGDAILRFDASTGAFVDEFVAPGSGGLDKPVGFTFGSDDNLYVVSQLTDEILRYGAASQAVFTVSLSAPSGLPVTVDYTTADDTASSGSDYTTASGTVTFDPGVTTRTILVPTLDDTEAESDETLFVDISNANGGVIQDAQGIATITDNDAPADPTKFYVVDDSVDDMYEYKADGSLVTNYNLGSGNNAPRGAAATAVGDTVWVIDNDDHVYVHDNDGNLLRSWKANGLSRPEGIATDGTDVWIVDRGNDRVHYFAGGATRTSDTGATSSFSLVAGNPRGITTDGTYLWVVDAGTDDVYKYTVGGTFLGSWALDNRNTVPKGITINPGNVSDIWVIDSTDDDIYQYTAAASRTSGSQSASNVYNLAAGNTNPQGIADPPPPLLPSTNSGEDIAVPLVEAYFAADARQATTQDPPLRDVATNDRQSHPLRRTGDLPHSEDLRSDPVRGRETRAQQSAPRAQQSVKATDKAIAELTASQQEDEGQADFEPIADLLDDLLPAWIRS